MTLRKIKCLSISMGYPLLQRLAVPKLEIGERILAQEDCLNDKITLTLDGSTPCYNIWVYAARTREEGARRRCR